jgi:hypothetical protein
MQFHSNLAIAAGYNMIYTYLTGQQADVSIAVYSGNQPTASDYTTGFLDNYTWSAGSQLLAVYGTVSGSGGSSYSVQISTPSSTGVIQLSEPSNSYATTRKRAGTASWAVIFQSSDMYNYVYNGSAIPSTLNFIIVPVSDLSGDGVIKFSTTEFNASTLYPIHSINFTPAVV